MDKHLEFCKRSAIRDPRSAAEMFDRQTIYAAIREGAEVIRKNGETPEQARARFMRNCPEGQALFRAHGMAKNDPATFKKRAGDAPPLPGAEVTDEIQRIAEKIEREEGISLPVARARAWSRHPELKRQYDEAQQAARRR